MYKSNQLILHKIIALFSTLLNWFSCISQYILPNSPGQNNENGLKRVNFLDNWWVNYQIRARHWRIPQMCHFISNNYGSKAELVLQGQRIVILTDLHLARRLMTNHGHSLRQRFGDVAGLKNLNMYNTGLIWNNDVATWKRNRILFEAALKSGSKALDVISEQYFEGLSKTIKTNIATPISMLDIVRDYTVTVTLEGIFGMPSNTRAWRDRAKSIVANYFKAWEFFLLGGKAVQEEREYVQACHEMLKLSQEILDAAMETAGGSEFINSLSEHSNQNGMCQCIAEMLLAGTDTSSLTMFYTLLYLADNPGDASSISKLLHKEGNADVQIMNLNYESMRLIPVGPVILRQAEQSIREDSIFLRQGDGIVFNVAGMGRSSVHYSNAQVFDPSRFEAEGSAGREEPLPLSFGTGKKSCVGKGFAEREIKLFFSWFLKDYTVLGHHESMVDQLETRWDIANTPVGDLRLSIFPRVLVYLVGAPDVRSSVLNLVRAEYPKVRIQDGDLGKHILTTKSSLEDQLIQAHLDLMNSFENEFVFIDGSIYDSIFASNPQFNRFTQGQIFSAMRNHLVLHVALSAKTEEEVQGRKLSHNDEAFVQFLNRSSCKYYSLDANNTMSGMIDQVFTLVRGF